MTYAKTILTTYPTWPERYGDPSWLIHDRFGLFIHWGIYSSAARHEWVMNREKIHPDSYRTYFDHFEPDLYDPGVWARSARDAGMKYFVVTSKHHDGFCLWDSQLTEYKATNTPAGRDLLRPMLEAFRGEGLKVGLYHSLIDWHHPEFPIDGFHPQREDEAFKQTAANRDIARYRDYLHGQVRELLTNYGRIDYLWFDFSYPYQDWGWSQGKGPEDWHSEELERLVVELQPHILLNDRLYLHRGVVTPEQYQPVEPIRKDGQPVIWEACQTLNGSWGYDRDNLDWKPVPMLVKMLVDTVSKGGNLLLNVGPNARGEFDPRSVESLRGIGRWMRLHGRSIYGATSSEFQAPPDCRYTQRGNRLYLHLFAWPYRHVHLEGLAGRIEYAQLLNDASEIRFVEHEAREPQGATDFVAQPGTVTLTLPVQQPDVDVPVVELFLKG
ncbi:MAG TPA: alpha-L-fucosidase [Ardenticatenaceae bacterium]|nr:alpha-L-fucosidase [Ardenticatenaceae bacterium]